MSLQQQISTKEDIPIGDIHHPSDQIFTYLEKTLRQNWTKETRNRGLTGAAVENEIRVIEAVENNPHVSQRFIARQIGIS